MGPFWLQRKRQCGCSEYVICPRPRIPYSCRVLSRGRRLGNVGREVAVVDLAAEQGHKLNSETWRPYPSSLFQARTSATARPLAARRGRRHAAAECASQQRSSAAQAFQGIGMVQRQELICPRRASPDQGRARWAQWASAQSSGNLQPAEQRYGLQASGSKGSSPPIPRVWFQNFWSPHGGSG